MMEWSWSIGGITGENQVFGENPIPIPRYPPQIPHGMAWD